MEVLLLHNILMGSSKRGHSKTKSKKQVGFLLSDKVSPLTEAQRSKLKHELHSGQVKVKKED